MIKKFTSMAAARRFAKGRKIKSMGKTKMKSGLKGIKVSITKKAKR
jgi:hypothetical protein